MATYLYTVYSVPCNGGTAENIGSGGLYCSNGSLHVPPNAVVTNSSFGSCGIKIHSRCTVSCNEGFTGDNVTYLCNITSDDSTMLNWTVINGTRSNQTCERSMSLYHMTR